LAKAVRLGGTPNNKVAAEGPIRLIPEGPFSFLLCYNCKMKITISTNKKLDIGIIEDFYNDGNVLIQKTWPKIHGQEDIIGIVEKEYGPKLRTKVTELKAKRHLLTDIASAISEVIEEAWSPIESVSIFVGACPIAPRFLDVHWFILPYYYDISTLINLAAHEMIHFLYFKKWSSLFPCTKDEEYEQPNPECVLSEILVAIIGNNPKIRDLVGCNFDIYQNWQSFKYDGQKLVDIFTNIYSGSDSFDTFLKNSWKKYKELDNKYRITEELSADPF
jgi:hypothetical protein